MMLASGVSGLERRAWMMSSGDGGDFLLSGFDVAEPRRAESMQPLAKCLGDLRAAFASVIRSTSSSLAPTSARTSTSASTDVQHGGERRLVEAREVVEVERRGRPRLVDAAATGRRHRWRLAIDNCRLASDRLRLRGWRSGAICLRQLAGCACTRLARISRRAIRIGGGEDRGHGVGALRRADARGLLARDPVGQFAFEHLQTVGIGVAEQPRVVRSRRPAVSRAARRAPGPPGPGRKYESTTATVWACSRARYGTSDSTRACSRNSNGLAAGRVPCASTHWLVTYADDDRSSSTPRRGSSLASGPTRRNSADTSARSSSSTAPSDWIASRTCLRLGGREPRQQRWRPCRRRDCESGWRLCGGWC